MLDTITLIMMEDLFRLQKQELLPYERPDNTWVSVTIEMDLNVTHYERKVYTVFDMLSDVGGLMGIFITAFTVLASLWNFNAFDNYMVSRLFKIKKPEAEIDDEMQYFQKSDYI